MRTFSSGDRYFYAAFAAQAMAINRVGLFLRQTAQKKGAVTTQRGAIITDCENSVNLKFSRETFL